MNKSKLLFGLIALTVLGGVLFAYLQMSGKTSDSESSVSKTEATVSGGNNASMDEPAGNTDSSKEVSGNYEVFTSQAYSNARDGKRVLFFYASWCPTCRPADKSFSENEGKIPQGVTVLRVNYNDPDTDDQEKELANKYQVTYQHTFVQIDENGEVVTKWNGGNIDDLLFKLQ